MVLSAWAAWLSRAEEVRPGLLAAWGLAWGLSLLACRVAAGVEAREGARFPLVVILAASALSHACLVLAPPALSDDLYRYVHDGRVLASGRNPYAFAPADLQVTGALGAETERVNHPEVPTAYPPLAQLGFALPVILGSGLTGLKTGLSGLGLVLSGLLALLLAPGFRHRVVLVAWHPLLLLEVGGSGHVDVAAVTFVVAALYFLRSGGPTDPKRRRWAAFMLVLGAWTKLLPGAWALALRFRLRWPLVVLTVVLSAAAVLPTLTVKQERKQPGLLAYAEHWDFNGVVYPPLRAGIERFELKRRLDAVVVPRWPELARWTGPQFTTRALLGLGFLLVVLWAGGRRAREEGHVPVETALAPAAAFVIFSPTLHPWYLTWVLPFLALRRGWAWPWLCGMVGASYASALAAGDGAWEELAWPRWIEHGGFVVLLLVDRFRPRGPEERLTV
ncbi:MAG: hypothetical protein AAF533_19615 [Acidobacteriota bacterium]